MVKILQLNSLLLKEASVEKHTRTAQGSGKKKQYYTCYGEKALESFPCLFMYCSPNGNLNDPNCSIR